MTTTAERLQQLSELRGVTAWEHFWHITGGGGPDGILARHDEAAGRAGRRLYEPAPAPPQPPAAAIIEVEKPKLTPVVLSAPAPLPAGPDQGLESVLAKAPVVAAVPLQMAKKVESDSTPKPADQIDHDADQEEEAVIMALLMA